MDRNHMLASADHCTSRQRQTPANFALGPVQPPSPPCPLLPRPVSTCAHPRSRTGTAAAPSQQFGSKQMQMQAQTLRPTPPPPSSWSFLLSSSPPSYSASSSASPSPSLSLPRAPPPQPPSYSRFPPTSSMHNHHHRHSSSQPSTVLSPTDRLPPLNSSHHRDHGYDAGDCKTLPSLSSITGDMSFHRAATLPPPHWSPYNAPSHARPPVYPPDSPAASIMDTDGAASIVSASSPDRQHKGTPTPSSLTLDDPDVRLAAEALGDLRADFVSSPPDTTTGATTAHSLTPMSPPAPYGPRSRKSSRPRSPKPEPLLSLLTTAHPFVASTIGGATSVYGGAKNFSPRFKSGAEYVEGYLTPIANTVNSVGRVTGVEGGVRWFLGSRRRATGPTSNPDSAKRRRTGRSSDARDAPDVTARDDSASALSSRTARRSSSASTVDTLPAYDDQRSPAYTEVAGASTAQNPKTQQPWQTRLIMSTSGLSVAMSAESLRSLKYCLRWLRWANDHLNQVVLLLKHALEEYEKAPEKPENSHHDDDYDDVRPAGQQDDEKMDVDAGADSGAGAPPSRTEIAARINSLKEDVLKTLQDVVNNVSKYAGGALPENARVLVRRHLLSLPQRFRLATMSGREARDGESALEEGAQKVLVLAKEGLDMVTQVSGVLDGTIVSAEQWCERMGRKRGGDEVDESQDVKGGEAEERQDVKMGSDS